ncbi:11143_t:CDS:2 [Dentiscutata erythropus]|uniref:11143_t:CDS:1 n=1 Tax=Dentiscutata erythropus TaxID=1348616 RepID=A0A9N9D5S1_9GLOM|nr:11143_t:CDS:2 [Dentiscutata erythropus]
MIKIWHELLISLDPYHRTAIYQNNKSWLVREILYLLQVLDLHQTVIPMNIKNNTFNSNGGYYKYHPIKNANAIWIPLLPGFCDNMNLQYIQSIISQQYPNLFEIDKKLTNTLHKETLLKNNLDHLSSVLKDKIENKNQPICNNIALDSNGKYLSPQKTQALMVDYNKIKNELTNAKRTIKQLNQKIIELSNT